MSKPKVIELGKERFSGDWLRSVTEEQAIKRLPKHDKNQVINAWKQANGLSVRTTQKAKPKPKKKPESED